MFKRNYRPKSLFSFHSQHSTFTISKYVEQYRSIANLIIRTLTMSALYNRISPADSYFRTTASCVEGTEAHFSCECQNLDQPKANRYIECGLVVNEAKEVTTQKLEGKSNYQKSQLSHATHNDGIPTCVCNLTFLFIRQASGQTKILEN